MVCTPRNPLDIIPVPEDRPIFRISLEGDQLKADLLGMMAAIWLIAAFDALFARHTKARWWILHLFANILVCASAIPDILRTLKDPANALNGGEYSVIPMYFAAAVHAYHLIAFPNLSVDDWVHHVVFGGCICLAGLVFETGPLISCLGFFLTGFPGGLDYLMLALVKYDVMNSLTEKRWNARVNVWIRSPGCLFCAYTFYICWTYRAEPLSLFQGIMAVFIPGLVMLNGQYYMQVVVGNTHRKDESYSC